MKLKPCPFCGGEAEIETDEYGGTATWVSTISCVEGCCQMSSLYGPPEEQKKYWNKRDKDAK